MTLSFKKDIFNLTKTNKLISPPYVNETIFKHKITIEDSGLYSNIKLNNVNMTPHIIEILIDFLRLTFFPNISIIVEEARELIEELREDIAADNAPASISPLNPDGI